VIELSDAQARGLRLRGHLLADAARPAYGVATVADVVRDVCGLQAQDVRASPLSVRARLVGVSSADVLGARVEERSVVRNWYMRGTLHLVAAEDAAWLLSLVGPAMVRAGASRRRQMGITEDEYARALRVIRDALAAEGPLSRVVIASRLREAGIDPSGQRNLHILQRTALEGVICHGPAVGGGADSAFVLSADWLGSLWTARLPSRDARLAELARRYLAAHAPAEPRDLATWSGLPVPEAREALRLIEGDLVEVRVRGQAAWILAAQRKFAISTPRRSAAPLVRILPVFDGYLLGHRARDLIVPAEHAHHVLPGGGWLNPTVLVDGVAVAQWSTAATRDSLSVTVQPYASWDTSWDAGVSTEVADIARFRGVATTWQLGAPISDSTTPPAPSRRPARA
jgi:hypothetical protein